MKQDQNDPSTVTPQYDSFGYTPGPMVFNQPPGVIQQTSVRKQFQYIIKWWLIMSYLPLGLPTTEVM